jgi:hypothetical protein
LNHSTNPTFIFLYYVIFQLGYFKFFCGKHSLIT